MNLNAKISHVFNMESLELLDVSGLTLTSTNMICSDNDDPWFFATSHSDIKYLQICIEVDDSCLNDGDVLKIYYADDSSNLSESKAVSIPLSSHFIMKTFELEHGIRLLRIDPIERSGLIPIKTASINSFSSLDKLLENVFPIPSNENGVLVVTHELTNSGAPILAFNIARSLLSRDVLIVSFYINEYAIETKRADDYRQLNMDILPLFWIESAHNRKSTLEMLRWLKEHGYVSAILNTIISGGIASLFKRAGFNVVTLIHETSESIETYHWKSHAYEAGFFSDYLIFPCNEVRDEFCSVVCSPRGTCLVRPQGVYLENTPIDSQSSEALIKELDIHPGDKLILGSGTIDMRKGADLFVGAAILLSKMTSSRLHFVWVGDGDQIMKSWLDIQAVRGGLDTEFNFQSFMPAETYKGLLSRADVFWCTSRNDTFPSVILEAMRAQVPVAAFSGTVGADVILADGRGLLIESFSTTSLAAETNRLFSGEYDSEQITSSAHSWIEQELSFSDYIDYLLSICRREQVNSTEYARAILSTWDNTQPSPALGELHSEKEIRDLAVRKNGGPLTSLRAHLKRRETPVLLDVAQGSDNRGDEIIMDYCTAICQKVFDSKSFEKVPTHQYSNSLEGIRGRRKILCGTNLIYTHMERSSQWAFPQDITNFDNVYFLGVGMQDLDGEDPFSQYSIDLLHYLLDGNIIHSVRDQYTASRLKEIGINNVVNTACPTMWKLTPEFCKTIPSKKAPSVVTTVTYHFPDASADTIMLEILRHEYENVYIWLQGPHDYERCIRDVVDPTAYTILPPTLKALDETLSNQDVDYVGTRLNAGIRALNHRKRTLIVAVGNRARHISQDTGLPIIERKDLSQNLTRWINNPTNTRITLPEDAIHTWEKQFR